MADYVDLLITNDDLTVDPALEPMLTDNRDSIAQDLIHAIRESGLLVEIIGERDAVRRKTKMLEVSLLVDRDVRIIPGTTEFEEGRAGEFLLTAQTAKYGDINVRIEASK